MKTRLFWREKVTQICYFYILMWDLRCLKVVEEALYIETFYSSMNGDIVSFSCFFLSLLLLLMMSYVRFCTKLYEKKNALFQ